MVRRRTIEHIPMIDSNLIYRPEIERDQTPIARRIDFFQNPSSRRGGYVREWRADFPPSQSPQNPRVGALAINPTIHHLMDYKNSII